MSDNDHIQLANEQKEDAAWRQTFGMRGNSVLFEKHSVVCQADKEEIEISISRKLFFEVSVRI